ncbi:MAG: rRNA maturation RNase YbeY [Actinobacteria bacterium]|nr:rRNA maturation RNase YbeY [Actinomycetota bacterium]
MASARDAVRIVLRPFGIPREASLSLAFIDDATMRELNLRHRGSGRTTDVLAFGEALPLGVKGAASLPLFGRDVDGGLHLGDVVISGAQAERQARRRGRPLEHEVAFLAAHGALHLLGYEDETPAGYRQMRKLGQAAATAATERSALARVDPS